VRHEFAGSLVEPCRDELFDEHLRQWTVDAKVQCALGHRVALELARELRQHRAAEGEVAEVILEGGEARDDLALDAKSRDLVRNDLFGVGDDLEDRAPQRLERAALGLLDTRRYLSTSVADIRGEPRLSRGQ
jgi:hypothetical protein